jgi:hypothetical protein
MFATLTWQGKLVTAATVLPIPLSLIAFDVELVPNEKQSSANTGTAFVSCHHLVVFNQRLCRKNITGGCSLFVHASFTR